ncbi:MAG: lipoxygenase family protein [Endozoicomonas sp.]|uniref:lipoxygenase family protein n=1 Tax=Endozoicomonas sp. TaxID=1892382 RepID=UPI003D9B50B5
MLKRERKQYQWSYDLESLKGIPALKVTPYEVQPNSRWHKEVAKTVAKVGANAAANGITSYFSGKDEEEELDEEGVPTSFREEILMDIADFLTGVLSDEEPVQPSRKLDDYDQLFSLISKPTSHKIFHSDPYFAQLRLAGPNPMLITLVHELPTKLAVTDTGFQLALKNADSLSTALSEKRVFIVDYHELLPLAKHPNDAVKQVFAPIALFCLTPDRTELLPVAIQYGQDPKNSKVVYAENLRGAPGYWPWQAAKTIVQVADTNHHELIVHLGRTHLIAEAISVAVHRDLAPIHPLYKLLITHFEGTHTINALAAATLINKDGIIDKMFGAKIEWAQHLVAEDRHKFDFTANMLPENLKLRGVDTLSILPDYPYRDDGLLVWNAIQEWVNEYIKIYYFSDVDVSTDKELTSLLEALELNGQLRNLPTVSTREELGAFLTMIIFTSSAQHAAVNFPQKDHMTYAPSTSGAVWGNNTEQVNSQEDWLTMLPPIDVARRQFNVLYSLGDIRHTKLGDYRLSVKPRTLSAGM